MTTRSCQAVSNLVRYRFRIPPEARGRLELSEAVRYRRFRKQYSNFILATPADYTVSDLGLAVTCLMIGKNLGVLQPILSKPSCVGRIMESRC